MTSRSLKSRMISAGTVWILLALILAGSAISYLFIENVEKGLRSDLNATLSRLIAIIDIETKGNSPRLTRHLPDPRYETPFSGVYWQIVDLDSQMVTRSRSLWDKILQVAPTTDGEHLSSISGPAGQSLSALSLTTSFQAGDKERHYQVVVAQDRSILDETIMHFTWELTAAFVVLGAALIIAAVLLVKFGLVPFRQLRSEVEDVRKGISSCLEKQYPAEVYPLVAEVNELLKLQETSMEFARARASDLAHGLKTPLSILATLAHELEGRGEKSAAALLFSLSDEMNSRVEYQLKLSKLRQRAKSHTLRTHLESIVSRAVAVLERTRDGERLDWRIEILQDSEVNIDANDLVELVGVVLENAAKWAKSTVAVTVTAQGDVAELRVHDDGPGIEKSKLELVGLRGQRFDETVNGFGLGLAIAKEILAINRGSIAFESGPAMGTLVTVRLPLSAAGD
ncbi:signal transduction histidine kinase [Rhizobium sp. SORGH_AS 787]|nr:signal transduction histidine kinase [Rhizobium sp. SORGH_AS_0787]